MVNEEELDVRVGISKKVTGWTCIENEHVCVISNKTSKRSFKLDNCGLHILQTKD